MKDSTGYHVSISVLIAVYNVESYIEECFNSLLAQSLKGLEFILINDFSTDKSGDICDKYATADNRFKVVHNSSNLGQGASLNLAINIAIGDYLSFIDPDDWVDSDFYDKLYSAALKNDTDIVKAGLATINEDGILSRSNLLVYKINDGLRKELPLNVLFTQEYTTAIYRRSVIVKNLIEFPHIRNALDIIFLLKTTYYAKSFVGISNTYYNYRLHNQSKSRTYTISYFESTIKCFQLHVDFINSHTMDKKSYDFLFYRGLIGVVKRIPLFSNNHQLLEYRDKYIQKALNLMKNYKYDPKILLHNLQRGIYKESQLSYITNSLIFRVFKLNLEILKKIRNVFHQIRYTSKRNTKIGKAA